MNEEEIEKIIETTINKSNKEYISLKEQFEELRNNYIELAQSEEQLQNNWNELKNYLEKQIIDSKSASSQQYYFNTIYKYMQELEQVK